MRRRRQMARRRRMSPRDLEVLEVLLPAAFLWPAFISEWVCDTRGGASESQASRGVGEDYGVNHAARHRLAMHCVAAKSRINCCSSRYAPQRITRPDVHFSFSMGERAGFEAVGRGAVGRDAPLRKILRTETTSCRPAPLLRAIAPRWEIEALVLTWCSSH